MNALFMAHSGWRYIVLVLVIVAILKLLIGWLGKQSWSKFDQRLGVLTPIVIDIQWLLGIVLWLMAPTAWFAGRGTVGFAEHAGTMTLAIVAAHIGWARAKRAGSDTGKFKAATIGFLIAGLLVGLGVARITGWM
jgi:Na+-translocating ferredoxin:NAD+ oxidoreductase RnfA subunit